MHDIWKSWSCEMKQSPVDIFCLDRDGWCLACRALLLFFLPFPYLFCLASHESCYVFGQLPSYLLLHSNCHRRLLITQPCLVCHVPSPPGKRPLSLLHSECNAHVQLSPLAISPASIPLLTFFCCQYHVMCTVTSPLLIQLFPLTINESNVEQGASKCFKNWP